MNSPLHQQALSDGDKHYSAWQYNVEDHLKGKTVEEIRQHLIDTAFPYAVCFENLINDFNISSSIRNANAFNAKEVFYIGDKKIDRRGMVGVQNYMNIKWLPTIDDFLQLKTTYKIVGFDNIAEAKPMPTYNWEPNTMIVFGSEGVGLSSGMQSMCKEFVYIEQFGSIRSLNVATASGIAMNDIVQKLRKPV
jgi:tRNA G18 (ribose-2'-O)-methylase SpoU